jgi:predicted permease
VSLLHGLRHRLRVLLRGERYAEEQESELRFHLELEAMHQAGAGAPGDVAHARARRRLGNLTAVREEARHAAGFAFSDRLRQDFSYALRGLRRSPGFTAAVVLTFALGIGANAAVFSFLDGVFLQLPRGLSNAGDLRRLYARWPDRRAATAGATLVVPAFKYTEWSAIAGGVKGVADVAAYSPSDSVLIGRGDGAVPTRVSYVTQNYFPLLGVVPVRGRLFAPDEGRVDVESPVAILSHALWVRAFGGDSAVIGRTIDVARKRVTVIGIAAQGFTGVELNKAELFLPIGLFPGRPQQGRPWYQGTGNYLKLVARVPAAGDDRPLIAAGTVSFRRLRLANNPQDTTGALLVGPIVEARGPAKKGQEIEISTRVAGVAVIVLLIACANVGNLLLVRGTRRRREIAVRLALGVSRRRLLGQLFLESVLLALAGGLAAILIAATGGAALRRMLLPSIHWATASFDARLVAFSLAVAITTGLLAGLAPALQAMRADIGDALKAGVREGGQQRSRLRTSLLLAQAALSVVLLVGAGLFVRSLGNVRALPIGFDVEELIFASVSFPDFEPHRAERATAFPEAAARLASAPGVQGTALASSAPMGGYAVSGLFLPDRDSLPMGPDGQRAYASFNAVSESYFSVTGMRLVAGRTFGADERAGEVSAVVVNELMARLYWPGESALGKCLILIKRTNPCAYVVGIAVDSRQMRILEKPTPQYFVPLAQRPNGISDATVLIVRAEPGRWRPLGDAMRAELKRLLPNLESVFVRRMAQSLEPQLRPWRLGAQLFTAFGVLALVVAAVGVYSVIACSVSTRTHEMGVRIALGARGADLLRLVVGKAFRLVAIGVLIGVGLAFALGTLVSSLLYEVSARDPFVIAGAALTLLAVGAVASLLPAMRAAAIDPVAALRAE